MAICKTVKKNVERVAEQVGVKVDPEIREAIASRTEGFLLAVLRTAETICRQSKRKLITTEDLIDALKSKGLPFADILSIKFKNK